MRNRVLAQILIIFFYLPQAFSFFETNVEVFTEEQRLQGFAEHNRRNQEFEKERESDSGEIKERRKTWQKRLDEAVADYKAWKSRQKQALDESSEEYFEDRSFRTKENKELEEARKEYVIARNKRLAKKKVTVRLSEEKEYGLDQNPERVDYRKRALYFPDRLKNNKNAFSGSGSSGGSGSMDFGAPPSDFNPPISQPPAPEFFEPEIPSPPPPPEFDDAIPPPIFEDAPDF